MADERIDRLLAELSQLEQFAASKNTRVTEGEAEYLGARLAAVRAEVMAEVERKRAPIGPSSLGLAGATCPRCQWSQERAAQFCSRCGAALGRRCPLCGTGNAIGERFCRGCGEPTDVMPGLLRAEARDWRSIFVQMGWYQLPDTHRLDPNDAADYLIFCRPVDGRDWSIDRLAVDGNVYKSSRDRRYLAATRQRIVIIESDGTEARTFPLFSLREYGVHNQGVFLIFAEAGLGWRVKQPGPRFIDLAALAWVAASDRHDEIVHLGALASIGSRNARTASFMDALAEFFDAVGVAVGASRRK